MVTVMRTKSFLFFATIMSFVARANAADSPSDPALTGTASVDATGMSATADTGTTEELPARASDEARRESLRAQNGLSGSTGPFRLLGADSGLPGTFRFSLLGSFYTGSE